MMIHLDSIELLVGKYITGYEDKDTYKSNMVLLIKSIRNIEKFTKYSRVSFDVIIMNGKYKGKEDVAYINSLDRCSLIDLKVVCSDLNIALVKA